MGQAEFSFVEPDDAASEPEAVEDTAEAGSDAPEPELVAHEGIIRSSLDRTWIRRRGAPARHSPEEAAARVETYSQRLRYSGPVLMGKYLTANGSLDGKRVEGRRFKLPTHRFIPSLRLWNQPMDSVGSYLNLRFPPRGISSHGPRRADGNLLISGQ
jgi:hypothetical protein